MSVVNFITYQCTKIEECVWIICYSKLFVLLKLFSPGVPLDVEIMQLGSFVYNKMFVIVIIAIKET